MMAALLPGGPKSRASQARSALAVDRGNPLTRGLVLLLPMGPADLGQQCVIQGGRTTRAGSIPQTAGGAGNSYTAPLFGSGNYLDFVQPGGITSTTPCTIFWTQEPRGTTGNHAILDWKATGATNSFLIYESASTAAYYFVVGRRFSNSGAAQVTFSAAVGATTNNRVDTFCLVLPGGMDSVAGVRLFRNGAEMASGTSSSLNNFGTSTIAGQRIGAALGGATDPFEGLLANVGVVARAYSEAEAISVTKNPWQIYAPPSRIPLVDAATSGGSITANSTGAFAMTGTSAAAVIVNADSSGTVTLSGTSTAAVIVDADSAGTFDLTGTATAIIIPAEVNAESAGTFDLTGTATATTGNIPLTGGGFWEEEYRKMWKWANKKKPTIDEVVEYVEDEPKEALEVVRKVAPERVAGINVAELRNNTRAAEFVAQQLMVVIELRKVQIEREADEDDIEALLLLI